MGEVVKLALAAPPEDDWDAMLEEAGPMLRKLSEHPDLNSMSRLAAEALARTVELRTPGRQVGR